MPFAAIVPAIVAVAGDALTATGAVVNCYALHKCGRSVNDAASILSRINTSILGHGSRSDVGPCGVPQYNYDMCHNDLKTVTVKTSIPAQGEARFDNIPATCMDLATVLDGACDGGGPSVTPCGSACLSYKQLTDEQLGQLSKVLAPYSV
ncbi:hypothetical protein Hte_007957 [Hypoxylon texense]